MDTEDALITVPVETFAPVPRQSARGWTAAVQRRFIKVLAATGSVTVAATDVGLSRQSAYLLRAVTGADEFRFAWDNAVTEGIQALKAVAFDRAIHGEEVPVHFAGVEVGTRIQHNNQLLMRLLTHYDRPSDPPMAADYAGENEAECSAIPVTCENVRVRMESISKPIKAMTDADFKRNGQWGLAEKFFNNVEDLCWAANVRAWMRAADPLQGVLDAIDYLERKARDNPMITDAMVKEIAATRKLQTPWLAPSNMAKKLYDAERTEAMAFMLVGGSRATISSRKPADAACAASAE